MDFFKDLINGVGSMLATAVSRAPAVTMVALKGIFGLLLHWQLLILVPVIGAVWAVAGHFYTGDFDNGFQAQGPMKSIEQFVTSNLNDIQCLASRCGGDIFNPYDFFDCVEKNSPCKGSSSSEKE